MAEMLAWHGQIKIGTKIGIIGDEIGTRNRRGWELIDELETVESFTGCAGEVWVQPAIVEEKEKFRGWS